VEKLAYLPSFFETLFAIYTVIHNYFWESQRERSFHATPTRQPPAVESL